MPPVPVTRDFARRIDEHLAEPSGAHVRRITEASLRDATRLTWGSFMRNGEHMLSARLEGRTLTITGTRLQSRPRAAQAVLEALDGPLVVKLTPDPRANDYARPRLPAAAPAGEGAESASQTADEVAPLELFPFVEPRGATEEQGWQECLDGRQLVDNPHIASPNRRSEAEAWSQGWRLANAAVTARAFIPAAVGTGNPPSPDYLCARDYALLMATMERPTASAEVWRLPYHVKFAVDAAIRAAAEGLDGPYIRVGRKRAAAVRPWPQTSGSPPRAPRAEPGGELPADAG
jgi:hypothetical protein